jgi:hypothetical protein
VLETRTKRHSSSLLLEANAEAFVLDVGLVLPVKTHPCAVELPVNIDSQSPIAVKTFELDMTRGSACTQVETNKVCELLTQHPML